MSARLSPTGERAGARKWRCAFRTPIASAARPTKKRYGNMRRVSWTVSAPMVASAKNPGAITRTRSGALATPAALVSARIAIMPPDTARSIRTKSARLRVARYSVKTGMNAEESAPSARRRRRRFGSRKATKKASVTGPAPNVRATTMSRTYPRMRLTSVAALTTAAARATLRCMAPTGASPRLPASNASSGRLTARCGAGAPAPPQLDRGLRAR